MRGSRPKGQVTIPIAVSRKRRASATQRGPRGFEVHGKAARANQVSAKKGRATGGRRPSVTGFRKGRGPIAWTNGIKSWPLTRKPQWKTNPLVVATCCFGDILPRKIGCVWLGPVEWPWKQRGQRIGVWQINA